jgi:hypothetical protein
VYDLSHRTGTGMRRWKHYHYDSAAAEWDHSRELYRHGECFYGEQFGCFGSGCKYADHLDRALNRGYAGAFEGNGLLPDSRVRH